MRVFVAGATGAIGRQLVPRLVAAGHEVHGMTRSGSKRAMLEELGAVPVVADALDPEQVAEAVGRARAEVIVHQLTAIGSLDPRHFDRDFAATNRLRTEGTDHLLSAGQAVGLRRFVAQSYGAWWYVRTGGPVKSEQDPLDPTPAREMRESWAAVRHLEQAVLGAEWTVGIVLRYGAFYGPGTSMRRVQINGFTSLMDYCSQPAFASGGFIADSKFTGSTVLNGSQQQYLVRNSDLDGWTNGVWNQVFAGDQGAPAQAFPSPPYTTLATTPVSREKPFLYVDSNGNFNVWVPDVQTDSSGLTWANGQTPGHAKPISDFFITKPSDSVATLNNALAHKKSLILTPGIYNFSQTMVITNPDTIVLGMGLATIVPQNGIVPVKVQNVKGVEISDVVFDAGSVNSPALLQIGNPAASSQAASQQNSNDPADPSVLSDVYFRIGGAHLGKATTSLVVNSDDVILDNIWAWRADHGTGVGWTSNTADTGVVVNGDDVTATGLFVEHYQKDEMVWNGQNGRVVFFQNEMPYDPPSQAAWTQPDGTLGYPAVEVGDGVKTFNAWGIGSYSFFNQGVDIHSANGFVVPTTLAPGSVKDAFTIFLSTAGSGGIDNVINGTGGSSTIANPDVVVAVLSYP